MTEASQDKALQKKLVGAAVLIALAVIFLPMLFDGKKGEEPVSMQIKIPPKPVYDIPNRLDREPAAVVQAETPPVPSRTIEINTDPVVVPEAAGSDTQAPAEEKPTVAVAEPPAKAADKPATEKQPQAKAPHAKAEKTPPKKAEKPKPVKAEAKPTPARQAAGGAGYVVQVGSFSQKANADTLTRKLQAKGFPAFVEGTRAGGKSIYRVKVGPRPTREAADDLRQRLIDKQRLEGIIVSHH